MILYGTWVRYLSYPTDPSSVLDCTCTQALMVSPTITIIAYDPKEI